MREKKLRIVLFAFLGEFTKVGKLSRELESGGKLGSVVDEEG